MPHLRRIALASLFLLPIGLLHARALAEAASAAIAVTFLLRCAVLHDWRWLGRPWHVAALALWAWVLASTLLAGAPGHDMVQAIVALRLWLMIAALEDWLIPDPLARRWLWRLCALALVWIGLECWQQYLFGRNLLGDARWPDGSLTGPFWGPRAGSPFAVLLFPVLLPPSMALAARKTWWPRIAGLLLVMLGMATLILIGQRMPALLGLLGLLVCGLLLKRFRPAVIAALALGVVLLAALPVVSPPTYDKLVVHFEQQMSHFADSTYGQIYQRAATMMVTHPLAGFGFGGYRNFCADPAFTKHPLLNVPQHMEPSGLPEACAIHPHSFWLEAGVVGGVPGLLLFAALCGLWLWRSGTGLNENALRVGLFAAVLEKLWPIAATNDFYTMPMSGWTFLAIGWALGLAEMAVREGQGALPPGPPLRAEPLEPAT
jgi:hypothetical protein